MAKNNAMSALKTWLGGDVLGKSYYSFLLLHTSFLISNRLPGVFINTLMLGESNDVGVVMLYNMVFFLSGAVAMLVAAQVMHRTTTGTVAVIGVMGYNILYLTLIVILLSGGIASDYYIVLGILTGLADGFYWLSYGTLLSGTTTLQNRDSGLAIMSVCVSLVNLCVPLLSGGIISIVGGVSGYLVVFALAFGVSAITSVLALRFPAQKQPSEGKVDYLYTIRKIFHSKPLLYSLLGQGCKGIREGAFTFVLSIVLYQLIRNEAVIGFNTFLSAIVSIVSYSLMSRILTYHNRVKYMLASVVVLTATAVVSWLQLNYWMIFLFTVVNAFFCGYLENSCYTTFLDMLQKETSLNDHRPEIFAINETCLVLGRSIGIVIFLGITGLWNDGLPAQMFSLVVLVASQFITAALCGAAIKASNKEAVQ